MKKLLALLVLTSILPLIGFAYCGDGVIEGNEKCDAPDYGEMTCENLDVGYYGGTLYCTPTCQYDTSSCSTTPLPEEPDFNYPDGNEPPINPPINPPATPNTPNSNNATPQGQTPPDNNQPGMDGNDLLNGYCGDGVVSTLEECDQTNLNGKNCESLGYYEGYLLCDAECKFDASECKAPADPNWRGNNYADQFGKQTNFLIDEIIQTPKNVSTELLWGILAIMLVALCVWVVIMKARKEEREHKEILDSLKRD